MRWCVDSRSRVPADWTSASDSTGFDLGHSDEGVATFLQGLFSFPFSSPSLICFFFSSFLPFHLYHASSFIHLLFSMVPLSSPFFYLFSFLPLLSSMVRSSFLSLIYLFYFSSFPFLVLTAIYNFPSPWNTPLTYREWVILTMFCKTHVQWNSIYKIKWAPG